MVPKSILKKKKGSDHVDLTREEEKKWLVGMPRNSHTQVHKLVALHYLELNSEAFGDLVNAQNPRMRCSPT
jgi:hypothetical protein